MRTSLRIAMVLAAGTATWSLPAISSAATLSSVEWTAAAPDSYPHTTGGGAYDDATPGEAGDIANGLRGSDFACGDVVSFMTKLQVGAAPSSPQSTARLRARFSSDASIESGGGFHELVGASINYGTVAGGDGSFGSDSGINDDGGSSVTIVSQTYDPPTGPTTPGSVLLVEADVDDLEAHESVVVRFDVRLGCQPGTSPKGSLEAVLDTVHLMGPTVETFPGDPQVLTLDEIDDVRGAGEAWVELVRTIAPPLGTCPGVSTLTVAPDDEVVHCYDVTARGTEPAYDVALWDDRGTPDDTSDDRQVPLHLQDLDGDGLADDLPAGHSVGSSEVWRPSWPAAAPATLTGNITGSSRPDGGDAIVATSSVTANTQLLVATSGIDGGLESNGRMSSALAQRALSRRYGLPQQGPRAGGYDEELESLFPAQGPSHSVPVDATPYDLPNLTNALNVVARDYKAADGSIVASMLVVVTEEEVYEHSKAICDRTAGATIDSIDIVNIGGGEFVRAVYRNEHARTRDYAISFKVFVNPPDEHQSELFTGCISLHAAVASRWLGSHYNSPTFGQRVYNVDVWSKRPGDDIALVEDIQGQLEQFQVKYLEARKPRTFLPKARTLGSTIDLTMSGDPEVAAELSAVFLDEDAESERDWSTVIGMQGREDIEYAMPRFLDATLILAADGEVEDHVWVSDGTWAPYQDGLWGGETQVHDFSMTDCRLAGEQERTDARLAGIKGFPEVLELSGCSKIDATVDDVAGVGRHLSVGGQPLDVSAYNSVEAWVRSDRPTEICLHRTQGGEDGIACIEQPAAPEGAWVRWPLSSMEVAGIEGAPVFLVTFAANDGGSVDLEVSQLAFTSANAEAPEQTSEEQAGGCSCKAGSDGGGPWWAPMAALLVLGAGARRRRS